MESKKELYQAISKVMAEVKSIDKSMTVGEGKNSYKAVSDKDVKLIVGEAMQKHGLIMLPVSYETELNVERWEEENQWGKKMKQNVFVEAKCMYEIIHCDTGQSRLIPAYGHGIDPQDKAAGKATTYAMKTALLYAFMIPTGSIDDTDKTHSNSIETPKNKNKVDIWLSEKQFNSLKNDAIKASQALDFYDGKSTQKDGKIYGMKKDYRIALDNFITESFDKN